MKKEYISEANWCKMIKFFSANKHVHIGSIRKLKNFIEAIYWLARTGAQWRELPEDYGKWNSVFKRFNAWSKNNVWDELLEYCIQEPDLEYIVIDATIVRAHPCAAGYGQQDEQGLGRSKGGFTTKVHAKVDSLGNPLKIIITPGQASDFTQANKLLEGIKNSFVIGDKGYDSDDIREKIRSKKCVAVIPGKSNRKQTIDYDRHIYKERHVIECFFSKIKQYRRVFSRFDKRLCNYSSFLCFVGACVWLR